MITATCGFAGSAGSAMRRLRVVERVSAGHPTREFAGSAGSAGSSAAPVYRVAHCIHVSAAHITSAKTAAVHSPPRMAYGFNPPLPALPAYDQLSGQLVSRGYVSNYPHDYPQLPADIPRAFAPTEPR